MPSEFLKGRLPTLHAEVASSATVQYIEFDATQANATTGTIDEAAAYATSPIKLPALVDFNPSKAAREAIGADVQFDALVRVATEFLDDKSITVKVGDAFLLPTYGTDKFYVQKIVPTHQHGAEFLERMMAVSRRLGRR